MKSATQYAIDRIRQMAPPTGDARRAMMDERLSPMAAQMTTPNDPLLDFYSVLLNERGADGQRPLGPTMPEQMAEINALMPRDGNTTQNLMAGAENFMDSGIAPGFGMMGTVGKAGGVADALSGVADDVGITAYHGSPHTFDRFSMDRIGTGEGAQAYGHGLYFAESEDVARGYRDNLTQAPSVDGQSTSQLGLSEPAEAMIQKAVDGGGQTVDDAIAVARATLDELGDLLPEQAKRQYLATIDELSEYSGRPIANGSMYQVRLNASPDDFLDWDNPLSEQSEAVRRAFSDEAAKYAEHEPGKVGYGSQAWGLIDRQGLYSTEAPHFATEAEALAFIGNPTGEELYRSLGAGSGGDYYRGVEASQYLRDQGIPGLRYLDAGSRNMGRTATINGVPIRDFDPGNYAMDNLLQKVEQGYPLDEVRSMAAADPELLKQFDALDIQIPQGSSNYVVFDDNLIEILKRYGLIPPVAAGAGLLSNDAEAGQ